ncbi:hypothetical protein LEP1GSC051_1462 [Leptospira sp. P2653]|nr:hypothetical protein LEP1GSC051_1462 [Leptospira sp. P2653]
MFNLQIFKLILLYTTLVTLVGWLFFFLSIESRGFRFYKGNLLILRVSLNKIKIKIEK